MPSYRKKNNGMPPLALVETLEGEQRLFFFFLFSRDEVGTSHETTSKDVKCVPRTVRLSRATPGRQKTQGTRDSKSKTPEVGKYRAGSCCNNFSLPDPQKEGWNGFFHWTQ